MSNKDIAENRDFALEFSDWIGKQVSVDDEITLTAVRRMAAMLDLDPSTFDYGSSVPSHWYSMFFTSNVQQSRLGPDGHPKKGDFIPPIPLPRRMFVGRRVSFPGKLHIGDRASKRSEIVNIEQKAGRSGTLVFVTIRHTIEVDGQPVVVEDQSVVYRDAHQGKTRSTPTQAPVDVSWTATYKLDPVLVFRYSALTWNGHRIHYDADYARHEEGYPGCVMNGALTLLLTTEEVLARANGRRLLGLHAKLIKPLFVGEKLIITGDAVTGSSVAAWASDERGALAATCTLDLEGD